MIALVIALALPWIGSKPNVQTERHRDGSWTLVRSKNRFTGQSTCAVHGRGVEVSGNVATLRFPVDVDTSEAWIKIGNENPWPWRKLIPELRQMNVRLRFDSLYNPSEGRVALPVRFLEGASEVWVAPTTASAPRRFGVAGLFDALSRAKAQGCDIAAADTSAPVGDGL